MMERAVLGAGQKRAQEAAPTYGGDLPPPAYGGYGYPPQAPPGAYGAPPPYVQAAGVPPVYTCPTPAQPYYQQQQACPTYYTSPPPAAYPYQQQDAFVKPSIVGKPDNLPEDLERNAADMDASATGTIITPDIDVSIRHAFVRKVYCILAMQVLLTFGLAIAFSLSEVMAEWLKQHFWIAFIGLGVSLVCTLAITCVPRLGRRFPLNMFLLTLITLGMAMCICLGAAKTSSYSFFLACGITAAVVLALTLFAVQVKYDFTGFGPYVLVGAIVLLFVGVFCISFRSRIASCVYAGLAAVIFSFILVYDTQQVVGGKHRKYQYSVDDYVFAALTLYLDIVTLFMEILSLINNT